MCEVLRRLSARQVRTAMAVWQVSYHFAWARRLDIVGWGITSARAAGYGVAGAWMKGETSVHWKTIAKGPITLVKAFNENPPTYPGP